MFVCVRCCWGIELGEDWLLIVEFGNVDFGNEVFDDLIKMGLVER